MAELQRARQASPQARAAFEESLRQAKTKPDFERQHRRMKARFVRQTRSAKDPSTRQSRRHILALQRARGAAPESPSAFEARAPEPVMTREDILAYRHQRRAEGKRLEARPEQAQGRWQGTFKDDRGQRWGRIEREDLEVWVRLDGDHQASTIEPGTPVHVQGRDSPTITPRRDRAEPSKSHLDVRAHTRQAPSPRTSSPEQGEAKSRVRSQTRGGPASGDERSPTQRARANERGEPPAPKHRPSLEDWLEDQKGQVRHLQPGVRTEGRVSKQPIYLKEGRYYTLETDEHERFLLKGNIRLDKQRGERVSVFNRPDGYSLVRDLDRDRDR